MSFEYLFEEEEQFGERQALMTRLRFADKQRITSYETERLTASGIGLWDRVHDVGLIRFVFESSLNDEELFAACDVAFFPTHKDFLDHAKKEWRDFLVKCQAEMKRMTTDKISGDYPGPAHNES